MEIDGASPRDGSGRRAVGLPHIAVLLCGHVADAVRGSGADLEQTLVAADRTIRVVEVEGLCDSPSKTANVVKRTGNQHMVVGLCENDMTAAHLQTYARRAGFDTFALQVVEISRPVAACDVERDVVPRLAASCARAAAYPGALPENYRAVLSNPGKAISRRDLLTLPPVRYRVAPTIDLKLCAASEGCDLCSVCPNRAINREGSRVALNRAACTACGLCQEVCPQGAVQFPGTSAAEVSVEITTLLSRSGRQPASIAFVCRASGPSRLRGWLPVRVTCVNSLPIAVPVQTIVHGAGSVALVECRAPCDGAGSDIAAAKVEFCRELLERLGERGDRVVLLDPSSPRLPPEGIKPFVSPLDATFVTYGTGAAGEAVQRLAEAVGARKALLEHPASPLGLVSIGESACAVCGTCGVVCMAGALRTEAVDTRVVITFDPNLCTGCGRCVEACPERAAGAIRSVRAVDVERLRIGRCGIAGSDAAKCANCGSSLGSRRLIERVRSLLGDGQVESLLDGLCSSCRAATWSVR